MQYLTSYTASRVLAILTAMGHKAEAVEASRPATGTLYVVIVQAPWLPRPGMAVRVTKPSDLAGFTVAPWTIEDIEKKTAAEVS